jgi:hypothetical protein
LIGSWIVFWLDAHLVIYGVALFLLVPIRRPRHVSALASIHDPSDRASVLQGGYSRRSRLFKDKLGFECLSTWQDPPLYAIVARDQQAIHFRCAEPPTANPDKYPDELLDAWLFVEDADALYAK